MVLPTRCKNPDVDVTAPLVETKQLDESRAKETL